VVLLADAVDLGTDNNKEPGDGSGRKPESGIKRPGPLRQKTSSWAKEQTNRASCPKISLPQAMHLWPLARLLIYQYKRTVQQGEWLLDIGSTQSKAMR
jgi:hypothetical protein